MRFYAIFLFNMRLLVVHIIIENNYLVSNSCPSAEKIAGAKMGQLGPKMGQKSNNI